MSYECEDDDTVPRVNYFSNPDVSYLDKPTGTSTEDNARAVRESMVSHPHTVSGRTKYYFEPGPTPAGCTVKFSRKYSATTYNCHEFLLLGGCDKVE